MHRFYIMEFRDPWHPATKPGRAWEFYPTVNWLKKHDNGHAVSIGFILHEDITEKQLQYFLRKGMAKPCDYFVANHSGCHSRCIRYGNEECWW